MLHARMLHYLDTVARAGSIRGAAERLNIAASSINRQILALEEELGVKLFERTRVPLLGLIENMSYFCCPNCNHRSEIFGHGGARLEAEKLGCEFLGEIPLVLDIRTAADAGTPVVAAAPDSAPAQAFAAIARRLWAKVSGETTKAGPRIVIS